MIEEIEIGNGWNFSFGRTVIDMFRFCVEFQT